MRAAEQFRTSLSIRNGPCSPNMACCRQIASSLPSWTTKRFRYHHGILTLSSIFSPLTYVTWCFSPRIAACPPLLGPPTLVSQFKTPVLGSQRSVANSKRHSGKNRLHIQRCYTLCAASFVSQFGVFTPTSYTCREEIARHNL